MVLGLLAVVGIPGYQAAARTPVTFIYNWYSTDDHEALWMRLIEEFNESNERYYIDPIRGGSDDQLKTMIVGGRAPDLVDFDRYKVIEWALQGFFQPLDPIFKGELDVMRDYLPGPANETIFEGRTYAIPTDTDIRGLLWNKEILREAGLDDAGPETWDSFIEFMDRATLFGDTGEVERYGFVPWTGNWSNIGWIWHFGGSIFDSESRTPTLDHPGNIAAYEWLQDWTLRYGTHAELNDRGFSNWNLAPFLRGDQAMMVAHGEVIHVARELHNIDVGAGALPAPDRVSNGTWSGGFALAVPTGASNLDGVREVINFLTSPEVQLVWWDELRRIPSTYEGLSMVDVGLISPEETRLLDLVALGNWRPPYFGQVILPRLDEVDQQVLNREQTPTAALGEAQAIAAREYEEIFGTE